MKRLTGVLLFLVMVFTLSAALAQRAECYEGGFSVKLPDHFVENSGAYGADVCFSWHGKKLNVLGYASYQGDVSGADLFQVLTGYETDYGQVSINGMSMLYTRTEDGDDVIISYTWMDRGNEVSLEFTYAAEDTSVENTVSSIIHSISFDVGN